MMARFRPERKNSGAGPESDDFIIQQPHQSRSTRRSSADPVNLIRIFRLAQKNNLAFHPTPCAPRRAVSLINAQLRESPEATDL